MRDGLYPRDRAVQIQAGRHHVQRHAAGGDGKG